MAGDMKGWFVFVMWLMAGLMWSVFGLLFLFKLHYRFFAASFLALGALGFFIAWRWQKRRFRQKDQHPDTLNDGP